MCHVLPWLPRASRVLGWQAGDKCGTGKLTLNQNCLLKQKQPWLWSLCESVNFCFCICLVLLEPTPLVHKQLFTLTRRSIIVMMLASFQHTIQFLVTRAVSWPSLGSKLPYSLWFCSDLPSFFVAKVRVLLKTNQNKPLRAEKPLRQQNWEQKTCCSNWV